jgi:hypothetical protein
VLLTGVELKELVVKVATERFGAEAFHRSSLRRAVEARIREIGAWTPADDRVPSPNGQEPEGLAAIDWAITGLFRTGRLTNLGQGSWRLPPALAEL